jgi:hypothetical protein
VNNLMWKAREVQLNNRLHQIYEEVWETEDRLKLDELKAERLQIELELGEIRMALYLDNKKS